MAHTLRSVGIVFVAMTTAVVAAAATGSVAARTARRSRLKLVSVNVENAVGIALNHVIELRFNARVARKSLRNGSIRIVPAAAPVPHRRRVQRQRIQVAARTGDLRPVGVAGRDGCAPVRGPAEHPVPVQPLTYCGRGAAPRTMEPLRCAQPA